MPGQIIEAETLSNKTPSLEQSGQPTIVAKNEQKTSNSNRKPQSDSQNQTMESDAAVKEKKGNTESEASNKPLKPFKPSEEIAAEQAVDFPVDI